LTTEPYPGTPGPYEKGRLFFLYAAVEVAHAASSGGQMMREEMSIGQYAFIALVRDTEGNTIGLHSMR